MAIVWEAGSGRIEPAITAETTDWTRTLGATFGAGGVGYLVFKRGEAAR